MLPMNYTKILDDIFQGFTGPRFTVQISGGEKRRYGNEGEPTFTLRFDDPGAVRRLLAEGALGFGESYMDGSVSIEGDLEAYLRLRRQFRHIRPSWRLMYAKIMANVTTPKRREGQIAYHYDLGNEFFRLFLDSETMSYSAARFITGDESLGRAQQQKLELVCDWMALPGGAHVLDLGSGWGGFAFAAAKELRWNVTGYTLSKNQLAHCNEHAQTTGVTERTAFKFGDFLELSPETLYDGAVMIESLEHVGRNNLTAFLSQLSRTLVPRAPVYLQFTGQYVQKNMDAWTLKYVFPGGFLPVKQEFLDAAEKAGFAVERFTDDTSDYEKTMRLWIGAIERNQSAIEKTYGASFYRLWKLWTHGACVNFELGFMHLFRVLLRKRT